MDNDPALVPKATARLTPTRPTTRAPRIGGLDGGTIATTLLNN